MMKVYLNNNNKAIEIAEFFRGLEMNQDPNNSFFRFELNFNGDCSNSNFDYLVTYINQDITDIKVVNKNDEIVIELNNIQGKLYNLYENYNDENKNGNATIRVYLSTLVEEE